MFLGNGHCFYLYSSGTYTAPVNGYYNICAFLRFKKGGNAVDVTVYAVSNFPLLHITLTSSFPLRVAQSLLDLEMPWIMTGDLLALA